MDGDVESLYIDSHQNLGIRVRKLLSLSHAFFASITTMVSCSFNNLHLAFVPPRHHKTIGEKLTGPYS